MTRDMRVPGSKRDRSACRRGRSVSPDHSGRRDQQTAAQAEHPARYPPGHPQVENREPGDRRVHLKATDRSADAPDDSAG